jgi:hypothetical protein
MRRASPRRAALATATMTEDEGVVVVVVRTVRRLHPLQQQEYTC